MHNLEEIKEELKNDPHNPKLLRDTGRHYLFEGSYKLARDYFDLAVRALPCLLPDIILDYEQRIQKNLTALGPRLSLAGFQLTQNEIDPAILELEEILEVNPKSSCTYNVLGKLYIKQERIDEAILLLEKSMDEGIRDINLIEILAGAYLEKGRIDEAIRFYEEVLAQRPNDKNILRVLAALYNRREDYHKAALTYKNLFYSDPELNSEVIKHLEEILSKIEGSIFIREILAEIYARTLKPESAVEKLREILRLDNSKLEDVISKIKSLLKNYPEHPEASLVLGDALRIKGRYSEAVEAYHLIAGSDVRYMDAAILGYQEILKLCPEQVLARNYLAESYLYKSEHEKALQEYEKMAKIDTSSAEMVMRKAKEILKAKPNLLYAHIVLGQAYLSKGDPQKAAAEAEATLSENKKYIPGYQLLGEAYFNMKLCRKSLEVFQQAIEIDPFNVLLQKKYREVKNKEIELEVSSILERIEKDPWKMSLHLDLAKLHLQKGDEDEAIRELQIAMKDSARAAFALNLLGSIYRKNGRYDLALTQFKRGLELAPPEIEEFIRGMRFNLGTAYEAQGMVQMAINIYEEIIQEDIDFGELKKRLKIIKATSLQSMRTKVLLAVISRYREKNIVALWGREGKQKREGRKEDLSLSFGQNHNLSGFEFFMKGMYKAALEEFQLALQLDSKFAAAINNLSISLTKEGKLEEARMKQEEAVNLNPDSSVLRNNLGIIYMLLNHLDLAYNELNIAREIDPQQTAFSINLGDLYSLRGEVANAFKLYQEVGKYDILTELAEERLMYKNL